ncbi:MAG: PAS domain-containing sensor histidine kinase [Planctomycetota bacterium]
MTPGSRIFRYFLLVSLVAAAGILLVAGLGLRVVLRGHVIREAQKDAVRLSLAVRDVQGRRWLVELNRGGGKYAPVSSEKLAELGQELRAFLAPFNVVQIKVYDGNARIIYTTGRGVIGQSDPDNPILAQALGGSAVSRYETVDSVRDLAAAKRQEVGIVKTYVPIRGPEGSVIGSFEVSKDVTEELNKADVALLRGVLILLVAVLAAFGALSFLMGRSGRAIDSSGLALRESEEKYRQLFSAESDAIVLFDADTKRIVDFNDAALELYGYSRDEFLKLKADELSAEPVRTPEEMQQDAAGQLGGAALCYHKKKDRSVFPVEISSGSFSTEYRKVYFNVVKDITEREKAEAAIQSLAKFPGENPNPILRVSRTGVILYGNKASSILLEAWESGQGQLLPGKWHRVVSDALDSSQSRTAEVECDGRTFSLTFAPAAEAGYVNVYALDITERKLAEQSLKDSEERYRSLVETMNEGMGMSDADYNFTYVNKKFCEMLGYSREEVIGRHILEFVHDDHKELMKDQMAQRLMGKAEPFELAWRARDGRKIYTIVAPRALFDAEGRFAGSYGVLTDISDRKQAEEALAQRAAELAALNSELEAFSYSVSHGLRAPLRSMNGFSELLLSDCRGGLDERSRDYLMRIGKASRQMGRLIDDLLRFSSVTRSEMNRQTVDLSALVKSIAEELRKTGPDRQVQFVIREGLVADADKRLIGVVLEHLLDNAWKFTGKQSSARIEWGATNVDGRAAYFVRDDGVGFDPAYSEKLFVAFQRLHDSAKFPGTGIGLATVRRIVQRHGGRVWAEGEVERGATFFFTLE